ncbi:MAG: MBL fold metallo-hydrolase [Rhodospirillaceae bacterium]|nr:MBL fold metallo-hydrolase [Rhodospirillaceae bacterium]
MPVKVRFWGVRGSIACPSSKHVVYGGNTSCVDIECAGGHLILDAGTGLRNLGQELLQSPSRRAVLLLTHTHWDHINGFPFFAPAYCPGWRLRVLAGHLGESGGIESVLASQMAQPLFPIPLDAMKADLSYEDFKAGTVLTDLIPGVTVRTAPLNHPNGATGYRIETDGIAIAFITDTEHVPGVPDANVLALMQDADLAIYDSTYTDAEYPAKAGWGHSTWEEGVRLARQSGVKELVLFHHDPDHDDEVMARIEREARAACNNVLVARDNMVLTLERGRQAQPE